MLEVYQNNDGMGTKISIVALSVKKFRNTITTVCLVFSVYGLAKSLVHMFSKAMKRL